MYTEKYTLAKCRDLREKQAFILTGTYNNITILEIQIHIRGFQ